MTRSSLPSLIFFYNYKGRARTFSERLKVNVREHIQEHAFPFDHGGKGGSKHGLQWRREEEEDDGGRDHLASLPSVWKASGLDPSFMNFMADGPEMRRRRRSPCYSYYLSLFPWSGVGVDDSVSAASARRVPPLAYISRLLLPRALSLLRGGSRPGGPAGRSPEKHARGQPRTDGRFGLVW
jgi:hypothetical protein